MSGIFAGLFWLILAYLVLSNWSGANSLLGTGSKAGIGTVKALQGR